MKHILILLFWSPSAFALSLPQIHCQFDAGGDFHNEYYSVSSKPYEVPFKTIYYYFQVRGVFHKNAHEKSSFTITISQNDEKKSIPLSVATYFPHLTKSKYGFTGLQSQYEPETEAEIKYWCEYVKK